MPPGYIGGLNRQPREPVQDIDTLGFTESSWGRPPMPPLFDTERTSDIELFVIANPPNLSNPPNPPIVNTIPHYVERTLGFDRFGNLDNTEKEKEKRIREKRERDESFLMQMQERQEIVRGNEPTSVVISQPPPSSSMERDRRIQELNKQNLLLTNNSRSESAPRNRDSKILTLTSTSATGPSLAVDGDRDQKQSSSNSRSILPTNSKSEGQEDGSKKRSSSSDEKDPNKKIPKTFASRKKEEERIPSPDYGNCSEWTEIIGQSNVLVGVPDRPNYFIDNGTSVGLEYLNLYPVMSIQNADEIRLDLFPTVYLSRIGLTVKEESIQAMRQNMSEIAYKEYTNFTHEYSIIQKSTFIDWQERIYGIKESVMATRVLMRGSEVPYYFNIDNPQSLQETYVDIMLSNRLLLNTNISIPPTTRTTTTIVYPTNNRVRNHRRQLTLPLCSDERMLIMKRLANLMLLLDHFVNYSMDAMDDPESYIIVPTETAQVVAMFVTKMRDTRELFELNRNINANGEEEDQPPPTPPGPPVEPVSTSSLPFIPPISPIPPPRPSVSTPTVYRQQTDNRNNEEVLVASPENAIVRIAEMMMEQTTMLANRLEESFSNKSNLSTETIPNAEVHKQPDISYGTHAVTVNDNNTHAITVNDNNTRKNLTITNYNNEPDNISVVSPRMTAKKS